MPVIRISKTGNFSVISNEFLNDNTISFRCKGLLAYLLTKPDHWSINVKHLVSVSREGRDAVYKIIDELIGAGYIKREQVLNNGKFSSYNYTVFERSINKPLPENTDTVSTDTSKPDNSNNGLLFNTEDSKAKPQTVKEKKINFLHELVNWSVSNPSKYPKLLYVEFAKYWLEPGKDNKNKLRFEDEKYFDFGRRLGRWFKNTKDAEIIKYRETENKIEDLPNLFLKLL